MNFLKLLLTLLGCSLAPSVFAVTQYTFTELRLPGQLTAEPDGSYRVALAGGGVIDLPGARPCSRSGSVLLSVRPEQFSFSSDGTGLEATVRMLPPREALTLPIEEQMIVEFYSR